MLAGAMAPSAIERAARMGVGLNPIMMTWGLLYDAISIGGETMTSPARLSAIAQDLIDRNRYLTLATGRPGRPAVGVTGLVCPHGLQGVLLGLLPGHAALPQHRRPQVSIVIFDSSRPPGDTQAVYLSGAAKEVTGPRLPRHLQVYSRRSHEQGLPERAPGDVQAPTRPRLYRAVAAALFVLKPGGVDARIPVTIESPAAHQPASPKARPGRPCCTAGAGTRPP